MAKNKTKVTIMDNPIESVLDNIEPIFKDKIIEYYLETRQFRHQAIGGLSLADAFVPKVGKFCETVLRFLQFELTGEYVPFDEGIPNFIDTCRKLEKAPSTVGRK